MIQPSGLVFPPEWKSECDLLADTPSTPYLVRNGSNALYVATNRVPSGGILTLAQCSDRQERQVDYQLGSKDKGSKAIKKPKAPKQPKAPKAPKIRKDSEGL